MRTLNPRRLCGVYFCDEVDRIVVNFNVDGPEARNARATQFALSGNIKASMYQSEYNIWFFVSPEAAADVVYTSWISPWQQYHDSNADRRILEINVTDASDNNVFFAKDFLLPQDCSMTLESGLSEICRRYSLIDSPENLYTAMKDFVDSSMLPFDDLRAKMAVYTCMPMYA